MKKTLALIFTLILVSCGPVTPISTPSTKAPTIKFQTPNILDRMQKDYDFDLNVGIYAIDENNLFLLGSIGEFSGYPLQSIILRSEDGGKHWVEVMKPEQISRVIAFQLLPSGEGWALLLALNESLGPVTLFRTTDFGKSWNKLSEIPKDTPLVWPSFMQFVNEKNGQIDMVYLYGESGENYIAHLSTYNGGKTWKETGRYYPQFDDRYSQTSILSAYLPIEDYEQSLSLDRKSLWKIESTNEEIIISRKLPEPVNDATGFTIWQKDWDTITILPLHLIYKDGIIVIP